jgi:hypothetical protein
MASSVIKLLGSRWRLAERRHLGREARALAPAARLGLLAIVVVTPDVPAARHRRPTVFEGPFETGHGIPLGFGNASVKVLPLLSVWFGLSFVYLTLPNTRVRLVAALIGGIVPGTVWQAIQIVHVYSQVHLARYNPIYSSFAALPMLLLWIYFSWSVFMVGAELAFAYQNEAAFTSMARTGKVDQAFRERVAPRLAGRIARAFLAGQRPPTTGELAGEIGVAPRTVAQVLESLCSASLLARTSVGLDDGYLPARDPENHRARPPARPAPRGGREHAALPRPPRRARRPRARHPRRGERALALELHPARARADERGEGRPRARAARRGARGRESVLTATVGCEAAPRRQRRRTGSCTVTREHAAGLCCPRRPWPCR